MFTNRDIVDRTFKRSRVDVNLTTKFLVHALFGLGTDVLELRLMVREVTTDKATLRHIHALGRNGEEFNVWTCCRFLTENHAGDTDLSPIGLLVFLQKHGMRDDSSDFVDRELEHVVADFNRLLCIDHALSNSFGSTADSLRHAIDPIRSLS